MASSQGAPLTVSRARSLLASGFQALQGRKQEINDLNVYPVPDGDTGTNLSMTMRAIVDAVAKLPDGLSQRELCTAISQSALMGARGNSGVILSQIIRGALEVLGEPSPVTSERLVLAFRSATDTAYRAVRKPVEGTILTVLREMAEAASRAPANIGHKPLMDLVIAAGWKSVERTPSLLRVLAEAGVVDAGGYGLVVPVEGATNGRGDWETPIATRIGQLEHTDAAAADPAEEESEFTYCCSFLLTGDGLEQAVLESQFGAMGDSLLVVGGGDQFKVHVHTDEPGQVLALASSAGVLTDIEIDNMKEQTAARTERLKGAAASGPVASAPAAPGDPGQTQVVAVVAGEGNKTLFRSLGVDLIVDGGQSMNPSTEDLLRAVQSAAAQSVIILPNNGNVIMTAEQTVGLTDREVRVVPSRSIQAGLSAAVAYEKRASGAENARQMTAAVDHAITGEVTRAVRKSQVDGVKVKTGDFIGLVEDKVVVASADLGTAVNTVLARLLQGDREMLTVLLGEGEDEAEARAAVEQARQQYPKIEMDVHEGGQPYYPVLLAAE